MAPSLSARLPSVIVAITRASASFSLSSSPIWVARSASWAREQPAGAGGASTSVSSASVVEPLAALDNEIASDASTTASVAPLASAVVASSAAVASTATPRPAYRVVRAWRDFGSIAPPGSFDGPAAARVRVTGSDEAAAGPRGTVPRGG
jgi:hypothetical protein